MKLSVTFNSKAFSARKKSIIEGSVFVILYFIIIQQVSAQVYLEKQTRHRFAQLNFGFDVQSSFGGSTKYFDAQSEIQSLDFSGSISPRFLIGGTHFWGHADFYIAVPLYTKPVEAKNQEVLSYRKVETVFKFYPFRIETKKVRPYIGTSIAPFYHEQSNYNFEYPSGPELTCVDFPLLTGITFNTKQHLLELGLAWNYQNQKEYYISRGIKESITTPPVYATLSYRYILETTLSAEETWESGRTAEVTQELAEQGKLNSFYFGVGISSAFWLKKSSYNTVKRPYIEKYSISVMPDFTLGYYLHNPDINLGIAYRSYGSSTHSYGAVQEVSRRSFLFEATKCLFDYHGFVPFIGPTVSYDKLFFSEVYEGVETENVEEFKVGYGVTFGWDIRPNRLQTWLLRTNLRWYPNMFLNIEPDAKVSFDNLEFNFIQFIVFPGRMF